MSNIEIITVPYYDFKDQHDQENPLWDVISTICQTAFLNGIKAHVAGGCLRRIVENQRFEDFDGDIDVFFKNQQHCLDFGDVFHQTGLVRKDQEWKQTTYTYSTTIEVNNRDIKIQCIKSFTHKDANHLFNSFDTIPSMITTDGLIVSYHKDALEHIKNRNLVFNDVCSTHSAMQLFKRYMKFMKMGYSCSFEEDRKFLTHLKAIDKIDGIDHDND